MKHTNNVPVLDTGPQRGKPDQVCHDGTLVFYEAKPIPLWASTPPAGGSRFDIKK